MTHDHEHHEDEVHDHDRGLVFDLNTMMARRRMLKVFAGAGLAGLGATVLAACGGGGSSATTSTAAAGTTGGGAATTAAAAATSDLTAIPEETAGPYPGDGSNGVNVLTQTRHRPQRHPLELRLVDDGRRGRAADDRADGARHRDRRRAAGRRGGLPVALRPRGQLLAVLAGRRERELPARRPGDGRERDGDVHEHLPGRYSGRWPHIHFEVYPNVADGDRGRHQDRHVADRAARGRLQARSTRRPATSRA